jgi:hypothetical protein
MRTLSGVMVLASVLGVAWVAPWRLGLLILAGLGWLFSRG